MFKIQEVIKDLKSMVAIGVDYLAQCAGNLITSSRDKAEDVSLEEMGRRVKIALRALEGEDLSTSGAATTREKTSQEISQDMVASSSVDPLKLSDEKLRSFIVKLCEMPDICDEETDPDEILRRQMRVEAKRIIANHRRDMQLSVSAPLTTDINNNPLYDCAVHGDIKEVSLLLPTKDSESSALKGTIRFKSEKSLQMNQQPIDELRKEEQTSKQADFWFEVKMKMTEGFSIVGATLYENTNALSIDHFKSHSPLPKSTYKAAAHFYCESDPSNPGIFELYCYSSWNRLTDLSNVLVFHVKEATK